MKKLFLFVPIFFFPSFLVLNTQKTALSAETDYIGVETCKNCHEEKYQSFTKSPHGKKAIAAAPVNVQGCETCHGPGAAHVREEQGENKEKAAGKTEEKDIEVTKDIRDFEKTEPAAERAGVCLSCHENSRPLAFWDSGKHKKNDVACNDCHSIHEKNIYTKEYEICTKCHLDIKSQINKISRHPIKEGKVNCSDCHAQHGSTGLSMIRADSVNELCYTCHAEKRGPYLWEHPPVEENCANCHTPHGSTHAKLIKEKIPNLCQACHDWERHPGTRYSSETALTGSAPSNRFFARSCLNCHNAIHGSNAPVNPSSEYNSGKKFLR